MQAIRQFQEERAAWEVERERLEEQCRQEEGRHEESARRLAELSSEVEHLRAAQGGVPQAASPVQSGPDQPETAAAAVVVIGELKRLHAEKQLALMATIDSLRHDLESEQARADARAAELDATRRGGALGAGGDVLERRREEVRALEDETLRLREDLNSEKCKVVELKKAAHGRAAEWKQQLQAIIAELSVKERLEEENRHLRREVEQQRRELVGVRSHARGGGVVKEEELDLLSRTMGGQLMVMEQELQTQAAQTAGAQQLLELFLRHSSPPLEVLRRCCRRLADELGRSATMQDLQEREVPPVNDVNVNDLKGNLVKIINLLRYTADVMEAHDQWQRSKDGVLDGETNLDRTQVGSWLRGVFT
mmetsp:Transcript_37799/g.95833  ORF Transcript_37799/g.95833 Transcript_37799/m.95833 type:complete len:365 (-) Transcript_37799:93-1187(-)